MSNNYQPTLTDQEITDLTQQMLDVIRPLESTDATLIALHVAFWVFTTTCIFDHAQKHGTVEGLDPEQFKTHLLESYTKFLNTHPLDSFVTIEGAVN